MIRLNYLIIPVTLKYYFGKFHLGWGFHGGYLLSARATTDGFDNNRDVTDGLLKAQFGFQAGMAMRIGGRTEFYTRYFRGISDVQKNTDYKNHWISIGFSVILAQLKQINK
jgi:hypothetical protein